MNNERKHMFVHTNMTEMDILQNIIDYIDVQYLSILKTNQRFKKQWQLYDLKLQFSEVNLKYYSQHLLFYVDSGSLCTRSQKCSIEVRDNICGFNWLAAAQNGSCIL